MRGARSDHQIDSLAKAVARGDDQRSVAALVGQVGKRALTEQEACVDAAALGHRHRQRRVPAVAAIIDHADALLAFDRGRLGTVLIADRGKEGFRIRSGLLRGGAPGKHGGKACSDRQSFRHPDCPLHHAFPILP